MRPVEAAMRAMAAVEGDPDALVEISTRDGLTRVPIWKTYRLRVRACLDAVRDDLCEAVLEAVENDIEDENLNPESIREAFDRTVAP